MELFQSRSRMKHGQKGKEKEWEGERCEVEIEA